MGPVPCLAEYAQNSLRHSSTGLTPFKCILGYQLALAPWTPSQTEAPAVDEWFWSIEKVWNATHVSLQHTVRRIRRTTTTVRLPCSILVITSGSPPGNSSSACPARN